jgi:hypothetical protein
MLYILVTPTSNFLLFFLIGNDVKLESRSIPLRLCLELESSDQLLLG